MSGSREMHRRHLLLLALTGALVPLGAARQGPVKPLPRGATGRLLEIDRSPQSYARHIIVLATPTLRLTLACEDAADPHARAALRAALAGLHPQRKPR